MTNTCKIIKAYEEIFDTIHAAHVAVGHREVNKTNLELSKTKLFTIDQVNIEKEFSLRTLVGLQSVSGGQGFLKCNCSGKCERNCGCIKAGVYCNSKCHKNKAAGRCVNKQKV